MLDFLRELRSNSFPPPSSSPSQSPAPTHSTAEDAKKVIRPTGAVPNRVVDETLHGSYQEAAAAIGFGPAEFVRAQLIEFFAQQQIKLYNNDQVKVWLAAKRAEIGADAWFWRPLRKKDVITEFVWGFNDELRVLEDGYYDSDRWECRPYARLVPKHALEKVAQIELRFGEQVKFFVSHYEDPDADPFIMVRPAECDDEDVDYDLIFDAWDEPGFGI
jgi:hypothetical protein